MAWTGWLGLTYRCIHEDGETYLCSCPERQRKGKLAKVFGKSPVCILAVSTKGTECPDRKSDMPDDHNDTPFAKIGRRTDELLPADDEEE